jgi:ribonuclease D
MTPARPQPAALPPPLLVEDRAALERMLRDLADSDVIAVDTEADSFFQYQERICLVQVSGAGKDWIVDPLAGAPLEAMGEMLADGRRTKVFHDGEYDLLLLKRLHGLDVRGLFDTRVASAALGSESPGLASVLREAFGVQLDKSMQLSNWGQRPLTDKQISYARLDTHYLVELEQRMAEDLREHGRYEIAASEFRRLEAMVPPPREFDPDEFLRLKGARSLDRLQMRALRELFVMRDRMARERNVPPFKVLGHGQLVEVARLMPRGSSELGRVAGLSPRVAQRIGNQLLAAVRQAKELGPLEQLPALSARDGTDVLDEPGAELHERLKVVRKRVAERERIDASLVINRHVLLELALKRPETEAELDMLLPWQRELLGNEVLEAIRRFTQDLAAGRLERRRRRR